MKKVIIYCKDSNNNKVLFEGPLEYWFKAIAESGKNPFDNKNIYMDVEVKVDNA